MTQFITPKEIKVETLDPIVDQYGNVISEAKRLIFVDLSDVEEKYHDQYISNLEKRWKKFEKNVPFIVLPFLCEKKNY